MRGPGTILLAVGIAALCYGAAASWVFPGLPPSGGASGRLPSLYILLAGAALAIIGLAMQWLQTSRARDVQAGTQPVGVSPAIGLVLILVLIAAIAVAVTRL